MIWLARNQTLVVADSIWIRVLSLQPYTIRLSVTMQTNLHIVPCQMVHDVTARVTLAVVHGNSAGLEVDASGASVEQSCDELDIQDQMQITPNVVFITLCVGECVAFAETSERAATATETEQPRYLGIPR